MTEKDDNPQLTFNLTFKIINSQQELKSAKIIPFVDAATIEARKQAVKQLRSSGLFPVPPNLKIG